MKFLSFTFLWHPARLLVVYLVKAISLHSLVSLLYLLMECTFFVFVLLYSHAYRCVQKTMFFLCKSSSGKRPLVGEIFCEA